MKPSSAKNKGRTLQKWVVERILQLFPELSSRDVKSTSMGANGEDVLLSSAAFQRVPFYVEAKSRAKIAIYGYYEQPKTSSDVLLIVKENRKKPLAILDADLFFRLLKELNDYKESKSKQG